MHFHILGVALYIQPTAEICGDNTGIVETRKTAQLESELPELARDVTSLPLPFFEGTSRERDVAGSEPRVKPPTPRMSDLIEVTASPKNNVYVNEKQLVVFRLAQKPRRTPSNNCLVILAMSNDRCECRVWSLK